MQALDDSGVAVLDEAAPEIAAEGEQLPFGCREPDEDGFVPLGWRNPDREKRLVLSPTRTLPTAAAFVREFFAYEHKRNGETKIRTLHCYADRLHAWRAGRWEVIEDSQIRSALLPWLDKAWVQKTKDGKAELVRFDSNPGSVESALKTIKTHVYLSNEIAPPAWLNVDGEAPPNETMQRFPAHELLACPSKLLHIPTGRELPATPLLWNTNAVEFDYDPRAPRPKQWLAFLNQLFGDDTESRQLLQEWFGYCLTADTRQQKALLVIGPPRSGKGTMARVLRALVGQGSYCGPTVGGLAGDFGLQPLLGKALAIVSDARFVGDKVATAVERLLCVIGEDSISINRKHVSAIEVKLPTRFVFLTNEAPRFSDSSTALAKRFLVLRLQQSFYGNENMHLTNQLLGELPGILNWALDGWRSLHARGHFVAPQSTKDVVEEIEELSSPVTPFVRECCVTGAEHRVPIADLYQAWKAWSEGNGHKLDWSVSLFGSRLKAAFSITARQGTAGRRFYQGIALR